MNILKRITAFFTIKGKKEKMELEAAEVNRDGIILHPTSDPEHSFFVKTDEVEIHINPLSELSDDDILVIDNDKKKDKKEVEKKKNENPASPDLHYVRPKALSHFMPSKKRFSVMLYPDEYDMLMKTIKENGYKKVEYFLACMTSAKKQSLSSEYKHYTMNHAKRYKTDLSEAKRAQAEDYYSRRAAVENEKTIA